jgi:ribonuclease T1
MQNPRHLLRRRPLLALLLLILLLTLGYTARAFDHGGSGSPAPPPTGVSQPASGHANDSGGANGLTPLSALPAQARQTVSLIQRGGPFPYRSDGIIFNNSERHLPIKPRGYYHEYTVVTPGSPDRGERRIITGGSGEFYYTADHYNTFVRLAVQS